ncbi:hypothetical protein Trichorick_01164 [Candidatus Trichorickettsia mobilis]|uniref:Uncharacterized protein n=1 Tax=Candidatus Trichorickettsia mobilis TaxID=1346319 RepID=A0ABZ0UUT0_9RICK|nr:hypothetical protein [Candidatus Trichorickettsia mobilis]WPY01256.1 hypothetical protein Trichorick_01164 [Candidatus Trichorickettsia mobilis]
MKGIEQLFKTNMTQADIVRDGYNVSAAARRFGIKETADTLSFDVGCPGVMHPLDETPVIEKVWILPFSGVKGDKAERATQFVNALRITDLLILECAEEAVAMMQALDVRGKQILDVRGKVMLCSIIDANQQLFPDFQLVREIVKANMNIDPNNVSYPDKSPVTDGQIAELYIRPYLAELDAISPTEEHKEAESTVTAPEKVDIGVLAQLMVADGSINGYEDTLRELKQNPNDFNSLHEAVSSLLTTDLELKVNAVLLGLDYLDN